MQHLKFTRPDFMSTLAFVAIVAFVLAAFVQGTYLANRKVGTRASRRALLAGCGVLLWISVLSLIIATGIVEARPFPALPIFFGIANLAAVIVALSTVGNRLALGLPLSALIGFQAFRLPLELVLHKWARDGVIPATMTWSGANFDVLSGILALVSAPFAGRFRFAGWLFNILGFGLLLNIMRVAVMSSPFPFAWKVEPPLQLAFHLPFAWIVPVCVAGALCGHIVLTRALIGKHRIP